MWNFDQILRDLARSAAFSFICITIILFGLAAPAHSQSERDGVYIIYDSSNSMWGALPDETRKYEAARAAMRDLVALDIGDRDIALRMYGHSRKDDCSDSALVVPFGSQSRNSSLMIEAMDAARPTGRTPIDRSLRAALADFGARKGTIILVSDGVESCEADPCALVRAWRDKDIDIQLHVVGLGLSGKERAAMECIADAAGTDYLDADSAGELAERLEQATQGEVVEQAVENEPLEPGESTPLEQTMVPDAVLELRTPDGELRVGHGTLLPIEGGEAIPVETFKRYTLPAGSYVFSGGVELIGGEIFMPQEAAVELGDNGRSVIKIAVPMPPQVSARFEMDGIVLRDTVVTVFKDNNKLGAFKGDETAFVPVGTLEFRTMAADSTQTLSVTETFSANDIKEIVFAAYKEVRLRVFMIFDANGEKLQAKPTLNLLRGGEVVATLNRVSGGIVKPGNYLAQASDGLNQFETEIEVDGQAEQVLEIPVPSGSVTVNYLDASGNRESAKRVFIKRSDQSRSQVRASDVSIPLTPGTYLIDGFPKNAGYPTAEISIGPGDALNLSLKAAN